MQQILSPGNLTALWVELSHICIQEDSLQQSHILQALGEIEKVEQEEQWEE